MPSEDRKKPSMLESRILPPHNSCGTFFHGGYGYTKLKAVQRTGDEKQ